MQGFIYVLENRSMPGFLKIGKTERTPMDRCRELSNTSIPEPFSVLFAIYTPDVDAMEKRVHSELDGYRVNSGREFFEVDTDYAMQVITYAVLRGRRLSLVRDGQVIPGDRMEVYAKCAEVPPGMVSEVMDHIEPIAWKRAGAHWVDDETNCGDGTEPRESTRI